MPDQLTSVLFASYNGYQFNNTTKTTGISITPKRSKDGRTVVSNVWSVSLHFEIATRFGTTDPLVSLAVESLTHPGAIFIYRGRGLGNPDINTGVVGDVRFGPNPRVVKLEVIGSGKAMGVDWTVDFEISNCGGGVNPFGILEFSAAVTTEIDDAGFTTRSFSGSLSVANNRLTPDARQVIRSADAYRDAILIPIPNNFRRRGRRFVVSDDLSRLDFSWTDEELPVPLPVGIVDATLEDGLQSSGGLSKWSATISGNYRMAAGYGWREAAVAFFEVTSSILRDRNGRLGAVNGKDRPPDSKLPFGFGGVQEKRIPTCIIPTGFGMKHPNRYGKPAASFNLSYTITCALSDLLAATGMHLPILHDYGAWYTSVASSAQNPYGLAGLVWRTGDDPGIFDACGVPTSELRGDPGSGWLPPSIPTPPGFTPGPPPALEGPFEQYTKELIGGTFPQPAPVDSWVDYNVSYFLESDPGVLHVKKIPATKPDPDNGTFGPNGVVPPSGDATQLNFFGQLSGPGFSFGGGGTLINESQTRGVMRRVDESCVIFLRGYAVRAGYPISPPRLVSINGTPCILQCRTDRNEGFGTGIMGNAVQSLYFAHWNLRYVLPAVPVGPLPIPPNPMDKP